MDITNAHWQAFRYANQEKRSINITAELMGVPPDTVKLLLSELYHSQPELFPCEKESRRFLPFKLKGRKLLSYDQLNDLDENVDNTIKKKY